MHQINYTMYVLIFFILEANLSNNCQGSKKRQVFTKKTVGVYLYTKEFIIIIRYENWHHIFQAKTFLAADW
jgi:hypothetical protein